MTTLIPGRATPDATKAYADAAWQANPKISPDSWRLLEGCTIGKVAVGSYRLEDDVAQRETVRTAWQSGLNLVEVGPTYGYGTGLRVVGEELQQGIAAGRVTREQLVLVGKGGYVPEWMIEEVPAESVALTPVMGHCMSESFIQSQLVLCRQGLGVETLDGFLVHNPEVQLPILAEMLGGVDAAREQFYQRLTAAFKVLEQAVQAGELAWYGVSSNGFVADAEDIFAVDLAQVFACAQTAAQEAYGRRKRPMLRCIELPLNILELNALKTVNTKAHKFGGQDDVSVLELAARMHLSVLTNRPLNALTDDGIGWRLATAEQNEADVMAQWEKALAGLGALEQELNQKLQGWPQQGEVAVFAWSVGGSDLLADIGGRMDYDQLFDEFIIPQSWQMDTAVESLQQQTPEMAEWLANWQQQYHAALSTVLNAVAQVAKLRDTQRNAPLLNELQQRAPRQWAEADLAALALNAVASIPGVTCVLNGVRQPHHVADAVMTFELGDFPDPAKVVGAQ